MKRYLPLTVLLVLMLTAYWTGIAEYFSFASLKEHRTTLTTFVAQHPIASPICYMVVYAISTALSIPGGAILSVIGGFLFPQPFSMLFVIVGATTGAAAVFLAAKTALGEQMKKRAGPLLKKMNQGFKKNGASYLLFLRLVPLFPFWLVNLAPAFFHVSLFTFIWTTFVGIIPGAFVFTQAGVGLGAILDSGEAFTIDSIFNMQIRIALIALGIFALLPVVIKKF